MTIQKKLALAWLLDFLLSLSACEKHEYYTEGDYFFLRNKGADMPIWVRGNKASKVFILLLHGGPGGSTSHGYIANKAFQELEKQYAVVYWDQRASGISQGNPDPATITIPQFVEDLDKVVELIKAKYSNPNLFLMGHSWGGGLGTTYLLDKGQQSKISAWIDIDGSHNEALAGKLSEVYVTDYAKKSIGKGEDVGFWQKAIKWYESNDVTHENYSIHAYLIGKARGYVYNSANDPFAVLPIGDYIFHSPISVSDFFNNVYTAKRLSVANLDLTPQMHHITIPSLFLWGQHDGNLPVPLAQNAYDYIGTQTTDKSIVIFEDSAHSPMFEEPEKFAQAVITFIEKYR
jgi:pimeloyl-ACP methyl ester carboxylesterase